MQTKELDVPYVKGGGGVACSKLFWKFSEQDF